jgi:hypothetical protein
MKNKAQAHIPTSQTISIGEMDAADAPIPIGSAVPGILIILGMLVISAGEDTAVLSANIRFTMSIPV